MIEAYKQGKDLHRLTASLITDKPLESITKEERQSAKAVNFGLIYAMGSKGLQIYARNTYGVIMTEQDAGIFRRKFFNAYQGVAEWHKIEKESARRETRTILGRRRQWQDDPKLTEILNTPVQGTSADIVKKALAMLPESLKKTGAKIIGCIHDEIILEVPESNAQLVSQILKETMESAGREYLKSVPVEAETTIADSWAEK